MMTAKSLTLVLALAASTVTIASAKSWNIYVDQSAQAGSLTLPAGNYSVKVNGDTATFRNQDTAKMYTAPAKIENVAKKYSDTAVESVKEGDTEKIQAIDLGGTTQRLEFGQ
jgi:hypothetical protein